jgi:hypothetical protein
VARLLAEKGEPERALELLALVVAYPASDQDIKYLATPLQAELAAQLPPDVVTAAQARGRARTLEATAVEMLAELEGRKGTGGTEGAGEVKPN